MTRAEMIRFIQENTMESSEVISYLNITKQRLSDLKRTGKLTAIKKGIYLKSDVEERKAKQGSLRRKYYKPKGYSQLEVSKVD